MSYVKDLYETVGANLLRDRLTPHATSELSYSDKDVLRQSADRISETRKSIVDAFRARASHQRQADMIQMMQDKIEFAKTVTKDAKQLRKLRKKHEKYAKRLAQDVDDIVEIDEDMADFYSPITKTLLTPRQPLNTYEQYDECDEMPDMDIARTGDRKEAYANMLKCAGVSKDATQAVMYSVEHNQPLLENLPVDVILPKVPDHVLEKT